MAVWNASAALADGVCRHAICLLLVSFLAPSAWGDEYEEGRVQLELIAGASILDFNERYGSATLDSLPPLYQVTLPEGMSENEFLQALVGDPEVVHAECSWESETPEGVRQMVVTAVGGTIEDYLDQGIADRLRLAEARAWSTGAGVLVAVIDTGVLATHPALEGAIEPGGWDFVDHDADPTDSADGLDNDGDGLVDEGAGHGTMVAGIIHLVAPDARILPIRVLDDEGRSTTFQVAKAIRYAIDRGADVVNLSLGLTTRSSTIANEIEPTESIGVAVSSAAGNMGVEDPPYYPAVDSHVLSIAALDSADIKTDFSNWHSSVAVSAPGIGVFAPYRDGGYAIGAGTSFSAPFAAGICALVRSLRPELGQDGLYDIVEEGVVPIGHLDGNEPYEGELGSGRIDALEAILHALPTASAGAGPAGAEPRLIAYPNPASSGDPIRVTLRGAPDRAGRATLFDTRGRVVARFSLSRGEAAWSAVGADDKPLPDGVYFVRIDGDLSRTVPPSRIVLVRP